LHGRIDLDIAQGGILDKDGILGAFKDGMEKDVLVYRQPPRVVFGLTRNLVSGIG